MDEFNLIKTHFAPLAADFSGSLELLDDAALIDIPPGKELAVTKDAISQGVHFIGSEEAGLIAQKLLRVNLSDLAAMGASPLCYFLAAILPKDTEEKWVADFAHGLKKDQERYAIKLAGGDTISTHGSLSFSITALGLVDKGRALKRSGARPGDGIYVSGSIGDGALGLQALRGKFIASPEAQKFLERRYLLPEPHVALGQKLIGIANACMDVSDGLIQDLGHICAASHVAASVHRRLIPLSPAARAQVENDASLWDAVTGGGDDYELLFTAPDSMRDAIHALSPALELPITRIGAISEGKGVTLLDETGEPIIAARGFSHF